YEGVPLLPDARLDLTLKTQSFSVQNNIATVQFSGEINIGGTPRDPRLNGDIKVEQGEFRLPAVRARFTRTVGSMTFSEFSRFPDQTPTLDVTSESDYRDPSGQQHLVTLTVRGLWKSPFLDLSTSSGL